MISKLHSLFSTCSTQESWALLYFESDGGACDFRCSSHWKSVTGTYFYHWLLVGQHGHLYCILSRISQKIRVEDLAQSLSLVRCLSPRFLRVHPNREMQARRDSLSTRAPRLERGQRRGWRVKMVDSLGFTLVRHPASFVLFSSEKDVGQHMAHRDHVRIDVEKKPILARSVSLNSISPSSCTSWTSLEPGAEEMWPDLVATSIA